MFWGIIDIQWCNYWHLPSEFSSKFKSSMTIFRHKLMTGEGRVLANEMKSILKSQKPKRLRGLEVHQDGFKPMDEIIHHP